MNKRQKITSQYLLTMEHTKKRRFSGMTSTVITP
jgi:hypothetical protein